MQNESRPTVELKGFRDGMRLIIDPAASTEEIEQAIVERMASLGDSLSGLTMNLDLGSRSLNDQELVRLKKLLNENYGLEVKQIIGDSQEEPQSVETTGIAGVPALHSEERVYEHLVPMNEETRFIRHTLRSGQIERALEGNMVILGDVESRRGSGRCRRHCCPWCFTRCCPRWGTRQYIICDFCAKSVADSVENCTFYHPCTC